MSPNMDSQGFVLVEALTAVALIAIMVAMVAGLIASNAQATGQIERRRHAFLIARSALDEAGAASSDAVLGRAGRDGIYSWTVAIEPYGAAVASAPPLERVSVIVSDRETRRPLARLQTLRLAR